MPPTHLDEPQGFHDGDVCFFYCAGLNLQLKPEGVQLVKALMEAARRILAQLLRLGPT